MWIYYYVSRHRVAQLAHQVGVRLPVEENVRWGIEGRAKASAEGESSKLLSALGFTAKAKGGIDGATTRRSASRFTSTDEDILDAVRAKLEKSGTYSLLGPTTTQGALTKLHRLILFEGDFAPTLSGSGAERFARYEEEQHVEWRGTCGEIRVLFYASRDGLVSSTPLLPFLRGELDAMRVKGFATVLQSVPLSPLPLLPLFFGQEV